MKKKTRFPVTRLKRILRSSFLLLIYRIPDMYRYYTRKQYPCARCGTSEKTVRTVQYSATRGAPSCVIRSSSIRTSFIDQRFSVFGNLIMRKFSLNGRERRTNRRFSGPPPLKYDRAKRLRARKSRNFPADQ